jgi:hypothetical protein
VTLLEKYLGNTRGDEAGAAGDEVVHGGLSWEGLGRAGKLGWEGLGMAGELGWGVGLGKGIREDD